MEPGPSVGRVLVAFVRGCRGRGTSSGCLYRQVSQHHVTLAAVKIRRASNSPSICSGSCPCVRRKRNSTVKPRRLFHRRGVRVPIAFVSLLTRFCTVPGTWYACVHILGVAAHCLRTINGGCRDDRLGPSTPGLLGCRSLSRWLMCDKSLVNKPAYLSLFILGSNRESSVESSVPAVCSAPNSPLQFPHQHQPIDRESVSQSS